MSISHQKSFMHFSSSYDGHTFCMFQHTRLLRCRHCPPNASGLPNLVSRKSGSHSQAVKKFLSFPPLHATTAPSGSGPPHYRGLKITLRHTTLSRTPRNEGSARRREFYLTTHNTHKRKTAITLAGFESAIPASERRQTDALDGRGH